MDRLVLLSALQRADGTSQECALALCRGAEFHVFEGTTPTANLHDIYSRRAKHLSDRGLESGGFEEAVAALGEYKSGTVRLGQVTDIIGRRHYQLFLAPEADDVVGCLWVHTAD